MKFTFGICAYAENGVTPEQIACISSIRWLNLPKDSYEIIVVGNQNKLSKDYHFESHWSDLRIIDFNENEKPGWITKKKNIIADNSKHSNIVFLHDYIFFKPDWYEGFLKYGNSFDICLNMIINYNEEKGEEENRYRDLVLDYWTVKPILLQLGIPELNCLIPYTEWCEQLSKYCYISGTYFITKKHIAEKYRQNEELVWGKAEDFWWSKILRKEYNFSFNPYSTVKVNKKHNYRNFNIMTIEECRKFKQYVGI